MKAVVVDKLNEYSVQNITIDAPKAGEVKVDIKAAGVCHSDLSVINGTIPLANFGPVVLGHEGAGVVSELGEGVEGIEVGDHVALSWVYMCGDCYFCDRDEHHLCQSADKTLGKMLDGTARVHRENGDDLNTMMMTGCMAEHAIVPASNCVKIDKDIPFTVAAFVGCGVMTGVGAAIKTAKVEPGSTVAVVGCGGIGLSIIQGARIAGAKMVIAVDQMQSKLDMAEKFGATHTFLAEEAPDHVKALTKVGVDYGFEAVGIPQTVKAIDQLTRRGGTVTVVGVGSLTNTFDFNAFGFSMTGKTYKGCFYGSTYPKVDFPKLLSFYKNGSLDLDNMISKTYNIDQIKEAFADMEGGSNARGIIVFD